uniref:MARVEL domain-containing protein n=1 Tax=Dracunculus medinensis TaxID=318479 RepID=A0A0N4UN78_DRAME
LSRTKVANDDFLARVPYASLMASLICGFGVVLFAIMMAWASNAVVEQARRSLSIDNIPWLAKMEVFFVAVAIIMCVASIILLIIGMLSTGSTRNEFYRNPRSRFGGRVANAVALIVSYILNLFWLLAFAITAIFSFVYYIFTGLCSSVAFDDHKDCLDLSVFQPFIRRISSSSFVLCGGDVQQFCALSSSAFVWFIVALIANLLVIKGLVHFLICCSANYAHVTSGLKYASLKEVLLSGDTDADIAELRKFPNAHNAHYNSYSPYRQS